MDNKEISSNIVIQDLSLYGLSFPSGYSVKTDNLKVINGKKEGQVKVLSSKRVILAQLRFHDDLLEGFCIFKNEKGQKIRECVYEKGKKNGYICEYENRRVVYIGMCKDDKKYSELKEYNGSDEFWEEVKDGQRIGIWKFSSDSFEEGICYGIANTFITQVYRYKCGEKNSVLYEFEKGQMIEYDKNHKIVYIGEYEGDFRNGFKRKNTEKRLYDENKRVIYKGDYDENTYERKGDGWRYEYEGGVLKNVYVCKDGKDIYKWITIIETNKMREYDKNGLIVYEGEYEKNTFIKKGEGELYVDNDCLVYSGGWKNGKKEGFGILYEEGSPAYEGEWKEDQKNGKGVLFDHNENPVYDGEWKNDIPNGQGKYYEKHRVKYEGQWKNGKRRLNSNEVFDFVNKKILQLVNMNIRTGDELMNLLNDEEKKMSVSELVIEEECGNDLKEDFEICGFDSLEKLVVKKKSLMNVLSLTISNNPQLTKIETFGTSCHGTLPFEHIKTFVVISDNPQLESINLGDGSCLFSPKFTLSNLPKLTSLTIGRATLRDTKTVLFSDLPNLQTFTTGDYSFCKATSLSLSNVPFNNGKYTHANEYVFSNLQESGIQSDEASTNLKQQIASHLSS